MKIPSKELLTDLYLNQSLSAKIISGKFSCSENKINYYLKKYGIPKRTISEAIYSKHNPKGDPFNIKNITKPEDHFLLGLGLGFYWGEGNKKNKNAVRLGNVDPGLIAGFIHFLERIYEVNRKKLHFSLQIFSTMDPEKALSFWIRKLKISRKQFYKIVVTPSRGKGTYGTKVEHGVLTVHFNNTKLRNIIMEKIENISKMY